jgi:hypothetical protein
MCIHNHTCLQVANGTCSCGSCRLFRMSPWLAGSGIGLFVCTGCVSTNACQHRCSHSRSIGGLRSSGPVQSQHPAFAATPPCFVPTLFQTAFCCVVLCCAVLSLCTTGVFGISKRHITVSTVGVIPRIRSMATDMPGVSLALSLHAPNQELRRQIVPSARAYPLHKVRLVGHLLKWGCVASRAGVSGFLGCCVCGQPVRVRPTVVKCTSCENPEGWSWGTAHASTASRPRPLGMSKVPVVRHL